MDSVLDRRTVLRITDTPGKKSRWPPRRTPQAWRGPARFFSRGVGNPENRPLVKDGVHHARRFSAESQSTFVAPTECLSRFRPCLKAGMVIFDHAGRFPTLIIPGVFN